jgi:hypothetical protein
MAMTEKDTAAHAKDVAQRITEAEKSRPAGLEIAARAHEATLDALRFERLRLTHKYGANHVRVARIAARIDATAERQREVAAERQRATIPSPQADRGAAVIHGRVIDGQQLGLAGLSVRPRSTGDAKETYKDATDDVGHFAVTVQPAKPEDQEVYVILEVVSGNNRVVYRDSEPRALAVGSVFYTEIVIDKAPGKTPAGSETPRETPPVKTPTPPRARGQRSPPAKKR